MTHSIHMEERETYEREAHEAGLSHIDRLKAGEALCPACHEFSYHHWHSGQCGEGCEHDNGVSVKVISWPHVQAGLPDFSQQDWAWLGKHYPEIAAEARRADQ